MQQETALYEPIKAFLQDQGYTVKAEIDGADVVAIRGAEPPVIVEMKLNFSLRLVHQGIARLAVSDHVYLAIPSEPGRAFGRKLAENIKLVRRLGLGLLTIRVRDGFVEAHCDPGPYIPRKSKPRQAKLLREFQRRSGDPNKGGTRGAILTAYRQDALSCAAYLADHGACRGRDVAAATGVDRATTIMRADHYGWFERVSTGTYQLTEAGAVGLEHWSAPCR